jgi:hypothetical protein
VNFIFHPYQIGRTCGAGGKIHTACFIRTPLLICLHLKK